MPASHEPSPPPAPSSAGAAHGFCGLSGSSLRRREHKPHGTGKAAKRLAAGGGARAEQCSTQGPPPHPTPPHPTPPHQQRHVEDNKERRRHEGCCVKSIALPTGYAREQPNASSECEQRMRAANCGFPPAKPHGLGFDFPPARQQASRRRSPTSRPGNRRAVDPA